MRRVAVVGVVVVALAGCAEGGMATTAAGVEPLAKVEGWRAEADPGSADVPFGLVEVADDVDTAQRGWRENVPDGLGEGDGSQSQPGLYGSLDDLDLSRQALVVWHSGESGSCPGWLSEVDTDADGTVTIERDEHVPGDGCTGDYNPYRMVLAVDRDRLPDSEHLPTFDVDIDGITDGRVSAYPDRALPDAPGDR